MEFRDLAKRGPDNRPEIVEVQNRHITKTRYRSVTKNGYERTTYLAKAVIGDKKMTRFLTAAQFDALDVPEVAPAPKR